MRKAHPKIPLDANGTRLKKGDPVESTERFEVGKVHKGKVVGTLLGLIEVEHLRGCCDDLPSHRTDRSAAFLWVKG